MSDSGDIWQRYDAKVVQIQTLEAQLLAVEKELAEARGEREQWARVARQMGKKLQVARALAERLRAAQPTSAAPASASAVRRTEEPEVPAGQGLRGEFDRAREVLGLVLTALTKALDDDDDAVAELGRRLRHHAGGKLLYSITRGALTLVPVDGRYLVDRTWLDRLDLAALRGELDIAAQSGMYPVPQDVSIVHTQPFPTQAFPAQAFPSAPPQRPGSHAQVVAQTDAELFEEMQVEFDAYADESQDLPPPPPLPAAGFFAPPPLIPALPDEEAVQSRPREGSRALEDTVRTGKSPTQPIVIPNLRIGRLVKTPGGG